MVKVRTCSFCGKKIQPGRGTMYIRNDGQIYNFCGRKCRMAKLVYKKNPWKTRWTKFYGTQ